MRWYQIVCHMTCKSTNSCPLLQKKFREYSHKASIYAPLDTGCRGASVLNNRSQPWGRGLNHRSAQTADERIRLSHLLTKSDRDCLDLDGRSPRGHRVAVPPV